ncbi:hypothetical protein [Sphingobium sp. CECT 9361]|uniref:hypothetical protein n=1 Tax=Sphingobium sp. CECT 9361 TaxID=2845384 RepID=UPI001E2BE898|nr:hypothetical protein [Sphingobium sp. CECT 9361]CAH0355526.1 hypothetical protein SPH9361_03605 [Sphingobium sp. CECT 9361]
MNGAHLLAKSYWAAPLAAGMAVLALSQFVMPRRAEIREAIRHHAAQPRLVNIAVPTQSMQPPSPPALDSVLATGDAQAIAHAVQRLAASNVTVTTAQLVHDLERAGRYRVALAFMDSQADGHAPALWRVRFELARKLGDRVLARTLLDKAALRNAKVPARDVTEAAYALDAPEVLLTAATNRAIPALDAMRALDLARRFEAIGRIDRIAQLDAVTKAPWRQADPWLAIRLARRMGQPGLVQRYAMLLPPAERDAALEASMTGQGDKAALRTLLIERASRPGAKLPVIAEQLLAAGLREEAIDLLQRATAALPPQDALTQRLLYLIGPRPAPRDIRWLQARTIQGPPSARAEWIAIYAQRDRPASAIDFIGRHSLADRPDVKLIRLALCQSSGDDGRASRLFANLLDDPDLTPAQINTLSMSAPPGLSPPLAHKLADRRLRAGLVSGQDAMDLAWAAWNRGDVTMASSMLTLYMRDRPNEPRSLRLMADVQRALKGDSAARPWRERALEHTRPGTREQAEILQSLSRIPEALDVVDRLLAITPRDAALTAFKGELLLANGQPGRARKLLHP